MLAPAQPREQRLLIVEADLRRHPRLERDRERANTLPCDLAVDLEPPATESAGDLEQELRSGRDHERWGEATVLRQRCEHKSVDARQEQRAARGDRVAARADRRADDRSVAGDPREQGPVDVRGQPHLSAAGAYDRHVVQSKQRFAAGALHPQGRIQPRPPLAGAEPVQRPDDLVGDRRSRGPRGSRRRSRAPDGRPLRRSGARASVVPSPPIDTIRSVSPASPSSATRRWG